MARTGLARSTIYLRMTQGRFPKAVQIGSPNIVAWLESEIETWVAAQIRAARPEQQPAA
jgi:prophage regulatory protein